MSENKYKISILIPLHNGEEFLKENLDSIVNQVNSNNVELVLCDDFSTDNTYQTALEYSNKHEFINLSKNESRLGMDKNFEKAVNLANGEFIWFSGQDDVFTNGAISKVLEVLENDKNLDFVYMNYAKCNHCSSDLSKEKMLEIEEDIKCTDYKHFLNITTLDKLPSFLPSYILRKNIWHLVENKEKFYGTSFIHEGVLFEYIKDLNFYIIANPYIIGRIPDNGWQKNSLTLLDILSGDLEVMRYAYQNLNVIPDQLFNKRYKKVRKWLFNTIILTKYDKRKINEKIKTRLNKILTNKDKFIANFLLIIPDFFYEISFMRKFLKLVR